MFDLLFLFGGSEDALRELLHGYRDSVEEVAGPSDRTRNSGQIAHHGRATLVSLVDLFNLEHLLVVGGEELLVFLLERVDKVLTVENSLELSEEAKRIVNIGDNLEVFVNVILKRGFYC